MAGLSYPAILDAAWLDHLKPRAPDAPTVISLFAGCGGSSLGYSMAGYRELLAVEWDSNAAETFRLNFPEVPAYHGDIAKLSVDDVLTRCNLRPGELDVLDGSPPCQGFSTAGKRKLGDSRNQLFQEYVRLLRGLQPRAFIMENVSGLVEGKMKLIFAEIMRELKDSGYQVSARLMNAMYFSVPQSRERMIFIGLRDGSPTHPRANTAPFSCKQSFADISMDGTDILYPEWLLQAVKEIKRRETTGDRTKAKAFLKFKGTSGGSQGYVRLDWKKPATTLCKSFISVAFQGHPDDRRFLNQSECKRVMSFPDKFRFIGDFRKHTIKRLGNSVPPLFMRAIAEHVKGLLNGAAR